MAQEEESDEELMSQVSIDMKFDKTLYPKNERNVYFSEIPKAVLMAVEVSQKYEEMKVELENDAPNEELKQVKKGEYIENGEKIIFFTGVMTDDKGKEVFMEFLVKKASEQSCIMVTSLYELNAKDKFSKEARKAILSAKISK
ncbi:hypothetical protein [Flavobacterium sp.]|uniref:hypothetical protein n=1 Tax=Flavobacterium sp. TaxID=239 RepID=UPI0025C519F0|nr:hypothetical protein [Flavobacterium sp.]